MSTFTFHPRVVIGADANEKNSDADLSSSDDDDMTQLHCIDMDQYPEETAYTESDMGAYRRMIEKDAVLLGREVGEFTEWIENINDKAEVVLFDILFGDHADSEASKFGVGGKFWKAVANAATASLAILRNGQPIEMTSTVPTIISDRNNATNAILTPLDNTTYALRETVDVIDKIPSGGTSTNIPTTPVYVETEELIQRMEQTIQDAINKDDGMIKLPTDEIVHGDIYERISALITAMTRLLGGLTGKLAINSTVHGEESFKNLIDGKVKRVLYSMFHTQIDSGISLNVALNNHFRATLNCSALEAGYILSNNYRANATVTEWKRNVVQNIYNVISNDGVEYKPIDITDLVLVARHVVMRFIGGVHSIGLDGEIVHLGYSQLAMMQQGQRRIFHGPRQCTFMDAAAIGAATTNRKALDTLKHDGKYTPDYATRGDMIIDAWCDATQSTQLLLFRKSSKPLRMDNRLPTPTTDAPGSEIAVREDESGSVPNNGSDVAVFVQRNNFKNTSITLRPIGVFSPSEFTNIIIEPGDFALVIGGDFFARKPKTGDGITFATTPDGDGVALTLIPRIRRRWSVDNLGYVRVVKIIHSAADIQEGIILDVTVSGFVPSTFGDRIKKYIDDAIMSALIMYYFPGWLGNFIVRRPRVAMSIAADMAFVAGNSIRASVELTKPIVSRLISAYIKTSTGLILLDYIKKKHEHSPETPIVESTPEKGRGIKWAFLMSMTAVEYMGSTYFWIPMTSFTQIALFNRSTTYGIATTTGHVMNMIFYTISKLGMKKGCFVQYSNHMRPYRVDFINRGRAGLSYYSLAEHKWVWAKRKIDKNNSIRLKVPVTSLRLLLIPLESMIRIVEYMELDRTSCDFM